jgi:ABC-type transporter Mla subunit MlaD
MQNKADGLAERIDAIESAYEFMLAYAAQGRRGTEGGPSDEVRGYLERFMAALDEIGAACAAAIGEANASADALSRFRPTLEADAASAAAAIALVAAQPAISSQMIDNLNASVHVRTLLTDLFLIDGVVPKPGAL